METACTAAKSAVKAVGSAERSGGRIAAKRGTGGESVIIATASVIGPSIIAAPVIAVEPGPALMKTPFTIQSGP